jgi:nitrite reductase/ring-hydroxylating ferredoxin subunit
VTTCEERDCARTGAVRLHIPWRAEMVVCPAHARAWATRDGVVAEPLPDHGEEWP